MDMEILFNIYIECVGQTEYMLIEELDFEYFHQRCFTDGNMFRDVSHHQTISFIGNLEDGLQASNDCSHLALFCASRITAF